TDLRIDQLCDVGGAQVRRIDRRPGIGGIVGIDGGFADVDGVCGAVDRQGEVFGGGGRRCGTGIAGVGKSRRSAGAGIAADADLGGGAGRAGGDLKLAAVDRDWARAGRIGVVELVVDDLGNVGRGQRGIRTGNGTTRTGES